MSINNYHLLLVNLFDKNGGGFNLLDRLLKTRYRSYVSFEKLVWTIGGSFERIHVNYLGVSLL